MNFIEFLHSIDYFDLFSNALLYCHCGSQTEHAIQNGERCEDGSPQSPATYCFDLGFRISELTSLVPAPVRYTLRNDGGRMF